MKGPGPEASMPPAAACCAARHRFPVGRRLGIAALLLLLTLVGVFGAFHLRRQLAEGQHVAADTLAAVADLKVELILRWRKERLVDAQLLRATPYAARRALDVLAQPESGATRSMFTGWLDPLMRGGPYERVLVLDDQLKVRLVHPAQPMPALSPEEQPYAEQTLRTRQVVVSDLHRETDAPHPHLNLFVPLVVRREGEEERVPAAGLPPSPTDRCAAILVLQVNAEESLFPLLRSWPTPSRTAETLLVRRESEEVVFLNPLRHGSIRSLSLRRQDAPSVQAAHGRVGTLTGPDYRGVPVLAEVRSVPETSWFMVAKVDQAEVFGPIHRETLRTVLLIALLVLCPLLGLGLVWRQHLLGISRREMAERRQMETALRESEARFHRAVLDSPFPALLHAEDGTVLEVSHSWCDLTGYARDELRTIADWTERAYGERKTVVRADIDALYALKERRREGDYVIRTRQGEWRTWEFSSAPLGRLPDGRRLVVSMALDVTERRQAEAALRASEQRYRTLVENIPLRVFLKDLELRYVSCNQAYAADVGLSEAQLVGRSDFDLHPGALAQKYQADDRRILASGGTEAFEETCLLTGKQRTVQTFKTAVKDGDGRVVGLLGAFWDITERKQLEEERAALEVQLRQQQRLESLGTLAGGVAHEINNPINGIMNYAQLLQDRLPPGSPLGEYTGEILHETGRVATIVRNLLTFARDEKQSYSPARLVDIVEGTLSLIRTVIRHDQITLEVDVPEHLPRVACRSQQIQQVLMNLLTNARDALNERYPGHHPNKQILVTAVAGDFGGQPRVRLTVEDHGPGIPPEVQARMFEPFFTTKSRDHGTGLGLAVSHGIVREHQGRLVVETELGQGTRMHLELPLHLDPDAPPAGPDSPLPLSP